MPRKGLTGQYAQRAHVVGQIAPAAFLPQKAVFLCARCGGPVAQQIASHHGDSMTGQMAGEDIIAQDILGNAVDQLDHGAGRLLVGQPPHGMNHMHAVRGQIGKLLETGHGKSAPCHV